MALLQAWVGESVSTWAELWKLPRLEVHDELRSTNDRVRELAEAGAPGFSTVIAVAQTAGRGRGGKTWESAPGLGLWMSFLLRPIGPGNPSLTPLLVGLGTARAIVSLCPGLNPRIKWPNDLLLEDLKVCGILCEGLGPGGIVVGIGLNVHQHDVDFPAELRTRATSLELRGCSTVTMAQAAGAVLHHSRALLDPLPVALDSESLEELVGRDALSGRRVRAATGQEGMAAGISADGALVIEADGTRHFIRGGGIGLV